MSSPSATRRSLSARVGRRARSRAAASRWSARPRVCVTLIAGVPVPPQALTRQRARLASRSPRRPPARPARRPRRPRDRRHRVTVRSQSPAPPARRGFDAARARDGHCRAGLGSVAAAAASGTATGPAPAGGRRCGRMDSGTQTRAENLRSRHAVAALPTAGPHVSARRRWKDRGRSISSGREPANETFNDGAARRHRRARRCRAGACRHHGHVGQRPELADPRHRAAQARHGLDPRDHRQRLLRLRRHPRAGRPASPRRTRRRASTAS